MAHGKIALALVALSLGLATPGFAQQGTEVDYERAADHVVLRYQEILPVGGPDRGPSLTVYGDGRVVVHRPIFARSAGDYETRLSPAELDALVASVADGVADFDATAVTARRRLQPRSNGGVESTSTDPTEIHLDLDLKRYAARGRLNKAVRWKGIREDARRTDAGADVRKLVAAHQACVGVMQRGDLEKIR